MIAAKSFEFLSLARPRGHSTLDSRLESRLDSGLASGEDSAVQDCSDYSDGSESPPDYEEVEDAQEMVFNIHNDTLYSKAGSTESLELSRCAETKQKILQSTIFCIHRDAGCAWAGPLGKLKGHLNTCQKDAAACRNQCGAKIARVVMEDHMKYTCTKRTVNCLYCRRPFTGATVEEHQSACGFEPLFCERKCGQKVARNRIKAHQVNTCSKRLVSCKYCERSYTAETLQSHQIKCPKFLVPCPNRCGFNCAREEIELHMDECDYYEEECPHAEAGCRWKGSPLALEKHLADNAKRHLDISLSHTKRQAEYIEKLKMELERAATSYTGVLVWKINDITAKMEEARENEGLELVSLPFYTSQCGYKLQASLFLNGNGGGEDTHMSMYIKILPGEFDSILKWPFKHTISFSLMDQNPDRAAAVNIVESFLPDPNWPNFVRASKTNDPDQLGFGFPKYVPHAMLSMRDYIRDDTMFIKIRADAYKGVSV